MVIFHSYVKLPEGRSDVLFEAKFWGWTRNGDVHPEKSGRCWRKFGRPTFDREISRVRLSFLTSHQMRRDKTSWRKIIRSAPKNRDADCQEELEMWASQEITKKKHWGDKPQQWEEMMHTESHFEQSSKPQSAWLRRTFPLHRFRVSKMSLKGCVIPGLIINQGFWTRINKHWPNHH